MATYFQVDCLLSGLIDSNGNPLENGKVYTYAAGTTTEKATYLDSNGDSLAANPIILNAKGAATVYANGVYKFIIKDENDVLLETWDSLSFAQTNLLGLDNTWTGSNTFEKEVHGVAAVDSNSFVTLNQLTTTVATTTLPIGTITMYAGASAPDNTWIVCNGAALDRTTYATLFGIIGTTYGGGDGITTFNIPDLRGRFPLASGQGAGLTNRTLGSTGGGEGGKFTDGNLAHYHGFGNGIVNDDALFTGRSWSLVDNNITYTHYVTGNSNSAPNANEAITTGSLSTTLNIGDTSSTSYDKMPPFLSVNFIIKVSVS